MNVGDALDLARQSIYVLLVMAAPVMLVGLGVGLAIALIQALTQVQEMTLTFVPKILLMFASLLLLLPFMLERLMSFTSVLFDRIAGIG